MLHFDLVVENLKDAIEYVVSCGAQLAGDTFFDDSRTLFDPAGHPFCLDTHRSE